MNVLNPRKTCDFSILVSRDVQYPSNISLLTKILQSQIKLVFGPLVIQLRGSVNIHHYSPPLRWIIVSYFPGQSFPFDQNWEFLYLFLQSTTWHVSTKQLRDSLRIETAGPAR